MVPTLGNKVKAKSITTVIRKGPWRGMPMFSLTLEEKRFCPPECPLTQKKQGCYGDLMFLAKRCDPEVADFYPQLIKDLQIIQDRYSRGFVVRLHELGDFFSERYLLFWYHALQHFPALKIFGYSHTGGKLSQLLDLMQNDRWRILSSNDLQKTTRPRAWIIDPDNPPDDLVICPQQIHKTPSCSLCGLCMNGKTEIGFIPHAYLTWPKYQKLQGI
jgi:hypothetical protein